MFYWRKMICRKLCLVTFLVKFSFNLFASFTKHLLVFYEGFNLKNLKRIVWFLLLFLAGGSEEDRDNDGIALLDCEGQCCIAIKSVIICNRYWICLKGGWGLRSADDSLLYSTLQLSHQTGGRGYRGSSRQVIISKLLIDLLCSIGRV